MCEQNTNTSNGGYLLTTIHTVNHLVINCFTLTFAFSHMFTCKPFAPQHGLPLLPSDASRYIMDVTYARPLQSFYFQVSTGKYYTVDLSILVSSFAGVLVSYLGYIPISHPSQLR